MNLEFERKLPIPMDVKELYPLSYELEQIVKTRKKEIEDIFRGKSDKLALIIGPCSAPPVTATRVCFINRIQMKNPICTRVSLQ